MSECQQELEPRSTTDRTTEPSVVVSSGADPLGASLGVGAVRADSFDVWWRWPHAAMAQFVARSEGESGVDVVGTPRRVATAESDWTGRGRWPEDFVTLDGRPLASLGDGSLSIGLRSPDGSRIGPCRIRREPQTSATTRVLFASCHQPFERPFVVRASSREFLRSVAEWASDRQIDGVVLAGDQCYADLPGERAPARTIDQCGPSALGSRSQVRQVFQQRYRHFFGVPGFRDLCESAPCVMVLDDHEVIDNFGAISEHQSTDWADYREGALDAYADYQATRARERPVDGGAWDSTVRFGRLSIFLADLRTQRLADPEYPLLGREQFERFEAFLQESDPSDALVFVATVPLIHTPRRTTRILSRLLPRGDEFSDRWESPLFVRDRMRVLEAIHEHRARRPGQTCMTVGGDIHTGCLTQVEWNGGGAPLFQAISSGLSNRMPWWLRQLAGASLTDSRSIEGVMPDQRPIGTFRILPNSKGRRRPFTDLNFCCVEATPASDGSTDRRCELWGRTESGLRLVAEAAVPKG